MIGQTYCNDILNLVELRNQLDLGFNRIGFNNSHNLVIRQNSMYLNTFN